MKSRKIIVTVLTVLIIITLSISLTNRIIYGIWNVFSYPNRVFFGGYRYDNGGYIITLTDDEKSNYEVSKKVDILTGKRIYSKQSDFIGNGKVVYLHLNGNRYLDLASGGGG